MAGSIRVRGGGGVEVGEGDGGTKREKAQSCHSPCFSCPCRGEAAVADFSASRKMYAANNQNPIPIPVVNSYSVF